MIMKAIITVCVFSLSFIGCNKDESGDPNACLNQSMDFQSCLSCCESNGFSGASLPLDDNGNTLDCECVN